MKSFLMSAVLKRTVLDTMSITVRASNLEHAYEITREFVEDFPNNTKTYGNDVPFCVVENRESLSSEVVDIDAEDEAVA